MKMKTKYEVLNILLDSDGTYHVKFFGMIPCQGGMEPSTTTVAMKDLESTIIFSKEQLEKNKELHINKINSLLMDSND